MLHAIRRLIRGQRERPPEARLALIIHNPRQKITHSFPVELLQIGKVVFLRRLEFLDVNAQGCAAVPGVFVDGDEHIHQPRSLLCAPAHFEGRRVGGCAVLRDVHL